MVKSMTRSEAAIHTFIITYGSKSTFELRYSRIKKGSGKGKPRLQKVTVKSLKRDCNVDNLTWCV